MTLNGSIAALSRFLKRWFHKRNIIIVSEHKVRHIPIGGPVQFFALVLLLGGVCWASYSTGSFIAARSALKMQGQTLRSVANARIENNFTVLQAPLLPASGGAAGSPYRRPQQGVPMVKGPSAAFSVLDSTQLVARINLLENKLLELKTTNEAIVQRVQDKTGDRIEDLESVIKRTGLSPDVLKDQVSGGVSSASEGGPFIPATMLHLSPREKELFTDLDELAALRRIVSNLPLAMPVRNAQEQSRFGHRIDPFSKHLAFHSGLDLAAPAGARIYSTAEGRVASAGRDGAYGNAVDIEHGFGVMTRYGHLSRILVRAGQQVKKGEVIGVQGSTGRSTGQHLHYEVRYHDKPMNPKRFLEAGRHVSEN